MVSKSNKIIWKNFKQNWIFILPNTFGLGLATFLIMFFATRVLDYTKKITDPTMATLSIITFMFIFIKLLYYIGTDIFLRWIKVLEATLTNGNLPKNNNRRY